MLDQMLLIMEKFNELSKANPMLATLLGAGGATALVMSLRQIPSRIASFIFGQMTTSLVLNNAGWEGGSDQFRSFMQWYVRHSWARWSRNLSLETQWQHRGDPLVSIGAGFGIHFFWYHYRLFWFHKTRLESSGTTMEKYEITIRGLTRNQKLYHQMIEEFRYRIKANTITVSAWEHDKWGEPTPITKRQLETVIMNRELKADLIADIERFYASREWYEKRGLPYKRAILFSGPPGTGKTSLIKALASHFNRNVYAVNLNMLSDSTINKCLCSVPEGSIILIEDFDTNKAVTKRAGLSTPMPSIPQPLHPDRLEPAPNETITVAADKVDIPEMFSSLSLSGLLNALDGIVPLDGSLIFLSTNDINKIDPALLRNGRVDRRDYIGYLTDAEVRDYIELMFPKTQVSVDRVFKDIAGCDLMSLFANNRDDVEVFIDAIPQTSMKAIMTEVLAASHPAPTQQSTLELESTDG